MLNSLYNAFGRNATDDADMTDAVLVDAPVDVADPTGSAGSTQSTDVLDARAPSAQATSKQCTLATSIERPALSSSSEHNILAMLSLSAPEVPVDEVQQRPPVDIVACVDRSGSMSGPKIALMKQTLDLLVTKTGLKDSDRLGIVTFDNNVETKLELTSMDKKGRTAAQDVVQALQPGGATNLSGGLLKSVDVLNSSKGDATGRTRVVLLFTDGQANNGIRDTPTMTAAAQGAVAGTNTAIFTFGFGSDHNADMLRSIAQTASGIYYFISEVDDIPQAFADCLGGIMSVVAQNATLSIEPTSPTVAIGKVLGNYKLSTGADAARPTIELGDLYSEDEKDLLFELKLNALPTPVDGEAQVLRAKLRYFNVITKSMDEIDAELLVARPAQTPANQPINIKIDEQRNRMATADAMENASRLADGGDLEGGRALLAQARELVCRSSSVATPLSAALVKEMVALEDGYVDMPRYRSVGSKVSKMSAACHMQQRSNHCTASVYKGGSKGKSSMKGSWFTKSYSSCSDEE